MKSIEQYIKENLVLESNDIRFSKATLSAIRKNILNARAEFNINDCKFSDYEIYKSNGYTKFKYNCVSSKNSFKYDSLVHIYPKEIQLGDIKLSNKDTYNNPCKLLSSNYNNKTNETCLEYKLDGLRVNSGFDWLRGDIKLYIPTDIMNASESYNLDCKLYDEFMEDYITKKVEYHNTKIDRDDIIGWESEIKDNELNIYLQLETGKGYSTNSRKITYNFIWNNSSYNCDKKLNDRDYEAQIVRKFISGLTEFVKNNSELPEKVHINISQYLE